MFTPPTLNEAPSQYPTIAEVRNAAHYLYDNVATTGDGKLYVNRCSITGKSSRICTVKITGDAPYILRLRLRKTPGGNFVAYAKGV